MERKEKSEKAPALYDLTTLQREANRVLGYTAQQILDYLQRLYEKKLCTYPRTDSRYLTEDMEKSVKPLAFISSILCGAAEPETVLASQVCDNSKVSDHHAIVPTRSAANINISTLPTGEREILRLVALSLLRAVCPAYRYAETAVAAECGGHSFTVKGKTVLDMGWKAYADKEPSEGAALPEDLTGGQSLPVDAAQVKEGKTAPPKHFTEDLYYGNITPGAQQIVPNLELKRAVDRVTRFESQLTERLEETGQSILAKLI